MDDLALNFLGDLEVVRSGTVQPLPPSRKTRALLAYLALHERQFRRENLCELLWEIPDDPRGSLRWSLSKLRRLVDDAGHARIVADRTYVGFDASGVQIDVSALRSMVGNGLDDVPVERLEHAAQRYSGHFLEGLELSSFHEFHAWCVAERELCNQAQATLLSVIVARLDSEPERALPYARSLVGISPYDEKARASLISLLVALGRSDEAEQQYQLGSRMLKEAGAKPTGTLLRARRGEASRPSAPIPLAEPRVERLDDAETGALIGRDAELEQLRSALNQATADRAARLVLIRGEPGIGKSRLLEAAALMARDAGASVVESVAFESESIRPFALWIDGLRKQAPEAAAEIFGSGEYDNRERLLAGLSDYIAAESEDQPIVLLFDDMQWCDESSAAALHFVARTNRQRALLGVLAARDGELRDNAAAQQAVQGLRHAGLLQEIRLPPLSERAARRLIEDRAPGADAEQLCRECGGNPLIAIELARAELLGTSGGSLDELVRERLLRIGIDGAEVLRWAAVLAPRIDVATLEHVTELGTAKISLALESAERQAMLLPAERGFRFSHDLIARSVYNDISPARRQMMHRRVAELLEQQTAVDLEHAADLAHHASQSGDPSLATRAMVSAGRLCLRFFANDEALSLARKGLHLVDRLADRDRICLTLELRDVELAAAPLDDWEAAARDFEALAEQALDHGAMSHARLGYYLASYVRWMHGNWAGARDQILQSERVARGGTDEDHIVGMAEAARCLALLERDLTHADAMLMEAQALAQRKRLAHHAIPSALGMLRFHENRLDEAVALLEESRTLSKSAGDRVSEFQSNEYLAMIEIERGEYSAARGRCQTMLEIGAKLREGSEAPFARALDAVCEAALDDDTDALERAFDDLRTADAKHRLAYALTRAAMIDHERGRFEQAIARATEALEHAQVLDRATDILLAHIVLVQAHRGIEDQSGYRQHAAAIEQFDFSRVAKWARLRAESLLQD